MRSWLGCAAVPVLWCVRLRGGLGGKETMDQMERRTASCPFFFCLALTSPRFAAARLEE